MLSISLPGGNRETFPRDDRIRRTCFGRVWIGSQRHTTGTGSLWSKSIRRVHVDWLGSRLGPVLHTVTLKDGCSRH